MYSEKSVVLPCLSGVGMLLLFLQNHINVASAPDQLQNSGVCPI